MPKSPRASNLVAGIDLGGTNMQIGVVDARNRIIGRDRRKTLATQGCAHVIGRMVEGVDEACAAAGVRRSHLAAVGIAAPGAIDIPRGIVLDAPNLRWYDVPLRRMLERKLRLKVVLDNDVNGAVWGESQLGAGRGRKGDVLGVWLGTGVGGGLVLNGRLHYGDFFTAGEIGQTVIQPQGKKGRRTVEDFCSRTGMSRTIALRLPEFPKSVLHQSARQQGRIFATHDLAAAYRAGDPLTVEVVHDAADLLGVAIANLVTVLALGTVIIGGGVAEELGEPLLRRIRASFNRHVFPDRCRKCGLLMTRLQDDAGLLGAALLARTALEKGVVPLFPRAAERKMERKRGRSPFFRA